MMTSAIAAIILVLIALYLIPTSVACARSHHNTTAIFVLNLLLGWTFIGWALALVWAFTSTTIRVVRQ